MKIPSVVYPAYLNITDKGAATEVRGSVHRLATVNEVGMDAKETNRTPTLVPNAKHRDV